MPYRYVLENRDYSDYSSGRFFYGAPGHPVLPVRLSSEIFQRCISQRPLSKQKIPVTIYDPCCGSAYHLSTIALLHWDAIDTIIASDIDTDILSTAEGNLGLLTDAGVQRRINEIESLIENFRKASHIEALRSAIYFNNMLTALKQRHQIKTRLFTADATNYQEIGIKLKDQLIDLVISDIPYGRRSDWGGNNNDSEFSPGNNPIEQMLDALLPLLSADSVVAIVFNKSQKFSLDYYQQVDKFQIGKRRIVLLKLS
jgi:tRNA G10  N-methylase Trm11